MWIAKTQDGASGIVTPVWSIPERIDKWPCFDARAWPTGALPARPATRSTTLLDLLQRAVVGDPASQPAAVARYFELREAGADHADARMTTWNQAYCWMVAAFGEFLAGIALTPPADEAGAR